jgi:hypothetical protein
MAAAGDIVGERGFGRTALLAAGPGAERRHRRRDNDGGEHKESAQCSPSANGERAHQ